LPFLALKEMPVGTRQDYWGMLVNLGLENGQAVHNPLSPTTADSNTRNSNCIHS
jgi:hypothetical protein